MNRIHAFGADEMGSYGENGTSEGHKKKMKEY
jgi:hypothetical protein